MVFRNVGNLQHHLQDDRDLNLHPRENFKYRNSPWLHYCSREYVSTPALQIL